MNSTLTYTLPTVKDPDGDDYNVHIKVNGEESIPDFISYSEN